MTEIKKFEDLEKIAFGQQVLIGDEGIMRFVGIRNQWDHDTGASWDNPVFLSEVKENGKTNYKEVQMLMKGNGIYTQVHTQNDKSYGFIKESFEEAQA